ncbi:MAG: Gfo/Idh/MocA family oxidoreductase [Candidatus Pacearchaeota archaeon]|jgi:predicted dehydrogenase
MGLKTCVVGYGLMGRTHCEFLNEDPRVDSIDIIDPFIGRVDLKSKSNIKKSSVNNNYDLVCICTPTNTHYKTYMNFLSSKAILIEKPPTLSIEEAIEIEKISKKRKQIIGCAFVERFNPVLKKLIYTEQFKTDGHYIFERVFPIPENSWYSNEKLSGGPLLDLGIHDFDLLNWFVKRKPQITGVKKTGLEYTSELDFGFGLTATVISGWSLNSKSRNSIYLKNNLLDSKTLDQNRYPLAYKEEITGFLDFLEGKYGSSFPDISEGINALEIALECKKKA